MLWLSWLGIFVFLLVQSCDSKQIKKKSAEQRSESGELHSVLKNADAAQAKGDERKQAKLGHKKQVVDAIHMGPYHHGHSWGTSSVWPGFAGWGYPAGHPIGWVGYPSYKSHIPMKHHGTQGQSQPRSNSQSVKRWWPGYMGGWGNWGWGNTGYPGWGNPWLGWPHPLVRSGIAKHEESPGKRWWPGYMGGWGGWGWGNTGYPGWGWRGWWPGNWWGNHRSSVPKPQSTAKRQFIGDPVDDFGDYLADEFSPPWLPPFGFFSGFEGWGFPEFGFGPLPLPEFTEGAYYKSKIPKQVTTEEQESGKARQFVHGFHPGPYGWGGVIYPGFGFGAALPLLGAHHSYAFPQPFHKSIIPKGGEEEGERRQVINYHPGCYGWGGCLYPGCGYIGGFGWPCHHGCCGACCCRSKTPMGNGLRDERGKSRQEITRPQDMEGQADRKMLGNSMESSMSDVTSMAMGFPGVENFRSPFGSNIDPLSGSVASQLGISNQLPTTAMNEPNELMPQTDGLSELSQSFKSPEETMGEQSDDAANPFEELLTNFNLSPEGDTGMPLVADSGDKAKQPIRRANIPQIQKKQAVAYPSSLLPYYLAHHASPYTAVVPQHAAGYPLSYLTAAPQLLGHVNDPLHPSHSIHVGAPNVNVDVQTTRTHVAQKPAKTRRSILFEVLHKPTKGTS